MSKSKIFIIFSCVTLFLFSSIIFASEPQNLADARALVIKYYDSGEFSKDANKVADNAVSYLQSRIAANNKLAQPQKLAIVFDVDDTALSAYAFFKTIQFGGNGAIWYAGEEKANYPALAPALRLYTLAKNNNVAVFFVSGRSATEKQATEKNLKRAGYTTWAGTYFKPYNYSAMYKSIIPFKSDVRRKIEEQGYDIAINMGDQNSDLAGGYADRTFKLPNPCYKIQ